MIRGDEIGVEVIPQGLRVLDHLGRRFSAVMECVWATSAFAGKVR